MHPGFKFTEGAELHNGGMKFRTGGGVRDSVLLFSGFVYMYVCQQREAEYMLLESAAAIQKLSGAGPGTNPVVQQGGNVGWTCEPTELNGIMG